MGNITSKTGSEATGTPWQRFRCRGNKNDVDNKSRSRPRKTAEGTHLDRILLAL